MSYTYGTNIAKNNYRIFMRENSFVYEYNHPYILSLMLGDSDKQYFDHTFTPASIDKENNEYIIDMENSSGPLIISFILTTITSGLFAITAIDNSVAIGEELTNDIIGNSQTWQFNGQKQICYVGGGEVQRFYSLLGYGNALGNTDKLANVIDYVEIGACEEKPSIKSSEGSSVMLGNGNVVTTSEFIEASVTDLQITPFNYMYLRSLSISNIDLVFYNEVNPLNSFFLYNVPMSILLEASANDLNKTNINIKIETSNMDDYIGHYNTIGIYTLEDLQNVNNNLTADYILMNNIDASDTSTWNSGAGFVPIGGNIPDGGTPDRFTGNFNGNGYTISNLYINRPDMAYVALFGATGGTCEVTDLSLTDVDITGQIRVAGLVGNPDGVNNKFYRCMVSGDVTGDETVAGFVGSACSCLYYDCYTDVNVTCNGGIFASGFSGTSGQAFYRCFSTGTVSGALLNYGFSGNVKSYYCYWDEDVSGPTTLETGAIAKTTIQMKQEATFETYDFTNVWDINEGSSYPTLR